MVGIQLWELCRESPNPSTFLTWCEGSSLPGLAPPNDTVNSEFVVGFQPGDSGVVIGCKFDELTHTWSAEQFITHSHVYPEFTGKIS